MCLDGRPEAMWYNAVAWIWAIVRHCSSKSCVKF